MGSDRLRVRFGRRTRCSRPSTNSLTLRSCQRDDPEDGSDAALGRLHGHEQHQRVRATGPSGRQLHRRRESGAIAPPAARTCRLTARRWASGATTAMGTSDPAAAGDASSSRPASPEQAGTGLCNFTNLALRRLLGPGGLGTGWSVSATPITDVGARLAHRSTNPPVPYGAHRFGDPAADMAAPTNGFPLVVNGNANDSETTDFFANQPGEPAARRPRMQRPPAHRPRPRPVRFHQRQRARQLRERGPCLRQRSRGHQHRDRHRVVRRHGAIVGSLGSAYQNVQAGNRARCSRPSEPCTTTWAEARTGTPACSLAAPFDPNPHLVVVVTDGNPTLNIIAPAHSASEVNWDDYTEAVTSANRLKAGDGAGPQTESRIFVVGAGAAGTISEENFWGTAGPVTGQADILANDYLLGSAESLGDALRELALARCSASLDIEKQSVGGTATFDYTVNGSGLAPFTRNTAVANPTTNAPFDFTSPQFGVKYVQETPEPGWTLTNIACTAERRRHHHRHRHRRQLRRRAPPPASIRATPPCGRTSATTTPRPARTRTRCRPPRSRSPRTPCPMIPRTSATRRPAPAAGPLRERPFLPRRRRRRHAPGQPHVHLHGR